MFILANLLFALAVVGCARNSVYVYAPPELAGASAILDGRRIGELSATSKHYRWVGLRHLRQEISLPPRSETFAVLRGVSTGRHELRIEKHGYLPIVATFSFAGRRLEIELSEKLLVETTSTAHQMRTQ